MLQPDHFDVSPPLRQLVKVVVPGSDIVKRGVEAEPVRPIPRPQDRDRAENRSRPAGTEGVQSSFGPAQIPSTQANFEGMGVGMAGFTLQYAPPDTDGDIGPNHYVQVVNTGMTIFNRTGGIVLGPISIQTLFNGFTGECSTTDDGDATIRYDRIANRWVVAQFSVEGSSTFFQCVAVSTTPDPTGSYNRYQFSYNGFNDYPKMGLWPDGYYFTYNMFNAAGTAFLGGKVCAMDRTKMIAGATATQVCFDTGSNFGGLLASDLDGPTPPPAGSPNYVVALDTFSTLAFWKFHADFATPTNSTFTGPTSIPVTTYADPCPTSRSCVPQPGTTSGLDGISDRLMNRAVYRNFGDHEALALSHMVKVGTASAGVRFYELRSMGTTPTVFQQGTYAPDANWRWMSSLAFDGNGSMALGFSISSSTVAPSIRYTGRSPGDPPGTFSLGEGTIIAGTGGQSGTGNRWGDYSSMNIDPVDDSTFWFTQEYEGAAGQFNWHTRVASFQLLQPNDFSLAVGTGSGSVDANGPAVPFTLQTTVINGSTQPLTLSVVSGLPANVTATLNPTTIMAGQSSTLTITPTPNALPGTSNIQIKAAGTGATHTANFALTIVNTNQFPTVQLTRPLDNSVVTGTMTVTANAADADGTVASVKFDFPDGTSFTDTAAPYTTSWNTTTLPDNTAGVVKATVTDNKGAQTVSVAHVLVENSGAQVCANGLFSAAGLPTAVPDNNPTGITSTLNVIGNGTVAILNVSAKVTHPYASDVKITLISPGGTKFVVWNRAGGATANINVVDLPVTAFNGQAVAGQWKLLVQDLASLDTGTLDSWSMSVMGQCNQQLHWNGSASPNLPTIDNGSACTSLTVNAPGDAAVTKLDVSGRHDFPSVLRATLSHNGTTVTAFPVNTFSMPGPFSVTNRTVNGLTGDASGTWTLCIIDTDAFGDTGVLNTWSVHD